MRPRFLLLALILPLLPLGSSSARADEAKKEGSLEWHLFADTYYGYNFNQPSAVTAPSSTTVGTAAIPDAKNTYRYYDFYHNQISLSLLELSVLAKFGEVSLLADLDFGPFADGNAATGSGSTKTVDEASKHLGQAVMSYRPEGSRFSMDLGKMYSHIGAETVKSKDNFNYSRSVTFSYGMPFWHTGARFGYDVVPEKFFTNVYIYNGWNSIYDNIQSKSIGVQLKYIPSGMVTVAYNYIGGPERNDSERDRKTVHELNTFWTLTDALAAQTELVYGEETGVVAAGSRRTAKWYGGFVAVKYSLNDRSYLSPRFELFRDQHGYLLSAGSQTIRSGTLTYGQTLSKGLDLRTEARWDSSSSQKPFSKGLTPVDSQKTLLAALLFTY